jgi:hypothetical protein
LRRTSTRSSSSSMPGLAAPPSPEGPVGPPSPAGPAMESSAPAPPRRFLPISFPTTGRPRASIVCAGPGTLCFARTLGAAPARVRSSEWRVSWRQGGGLARRASRKLVRRARTPAPSAAAAKMSSSSHREHGAAAVFGTAPSRGSSIPSCSPARELALPVAPRANSLNLLSGSARRPRARAPHLNTLLNVYWTRDSG